MPPTLADADHRARVAVLDALARTPELGRRYVLKGGLALHYVFGSPRRSHDLDFDAVEPFEPEVDETKDHLILHFAHALTGALEAVAPDYGFAGLRVQRKRLSDEFPCILAEVGYTADPEEEPPFETFVEMQATLSEVVCATTTGTLDGVPLHVTTLEDILAGKLKALAQAPSRGFARPSDAFDLWYFAGPHGPEIDRERVADFLRRKVARWPELQPIRKAALTSDAVRAYAADGYGDLAEQLEGGFALPPFEEAFAQVEAFVAGLDLPD